jgi:hypothetical protein
MTTHSNQYNPVIQNYDENFTSKELSGMKRGGEGVASQRISLEISSETHLCVSELEWDGQCIK